MRAVGLIPARHRASRFPGKPLALIAGMPMIQRVWRGARSAKSLERVIVATDDARIADACRGFGAEVALTRADHASGTDRIAEVAAGLDCDVVVNVQGDEPLIEGFVIDAVVAALTEDPEVQIATLVHAAEPDALGDPNRVKVVLDRRGRALYFSRSAIPFLARRVRSRAAGSTSGSTPTAASSCCASRSSRPRPPSAPRGSSSCARSSTAFDPLRGDRGLDERGRGRARGHRDRRSASPRTWVSRAEFAESGERLDARTVREWGGAIRTGAASAPATSMAR